MNKLLGTNIEKDAAKNLLESIELKTEEDSKDDDKLTVCPPSFRVDIEKEADLAEEVARLYGYDNIKTTFPIIRPGGNVDMKNIMRGLK